MGAIGGAAIAAGATIAATAGNAYATSKMNKKTIKFNKEMYERQRVDSLADWNRQNEYNSPEAQMARYKAAGLNPNLIYGQTNTADAVRSSQAQVPDLKAPDFSPIASGARSAIETYQQVKMQEQQLDNMRKQADLMDQENALKAAQTLQTVANTDSTKVDTYQKVSLMENTLEAAQANLDQTRANTQVLLNRDEREAALNASNLKEAAQRIITSRIQNIQTQAQTAATKQQIENLQSVLKNDALKRELDALEIDLKKKGINSSDPAWLRVLTQWLERKGLHPLGALPTPSEFKDRVNEIPKKFMDGMRKNKYLSTPNNH